MPRYQYQCKDCDTEFTVRHSMNEMVEDCPECQGDSVERIMPYLRYDNTEKKQIVGSVVKKSIEEAKQEMERDRKEASRKEYKE